jgi:hypothetical protein
MAWDLTVYLENHAGTLAALGDATAKAGINVEGLCGTTVAGRGVIHLLVADGAAARRALTSAGFEVAGMCEVLDAEIADRPGALGFVAGRFAGAGIPLDLVYVASGNRLVFGVQRPEDLEPGRALLAE